MAQHPDPEAPESMDRLDSLLLDVQGLTEVLEQLARLATRVTEGDTSCGITIRYDGHLLTVGSSDHRAERLDETQYRWQSGPCLEALDTETVVEIQSLSQEVRWRAYRDIAEGEGLQRSLSLPLTLGGETFGAVNIYGFNGSERFNPEARRQLEIFTAQAAATLRLASRAIVDAQLRDQMEQALASRTVIDQALGIVMGQRRCTADEAFALLRRESQNNRARLRDVAAALVARISGEDPQPGRFFVVE